MKQGGKGGHCRDREERVGMEETVNIVETLRKRSDRKRRVWQESARSTVKRTVSLESSLKTEDVTLLLVIQDIKMNGTCGQGTVKPDG